MLKRFAYFVLFGNYYLAACIVALSAETGFKNGFYLTDVPYYLVIFFSVVVYYTYAYKSDSVSAGSTNVRTLWYYKHRQIIGITQIVYSIIAVVAGLFLLRTYFKNLSVFTVADWLLILLFPFIALLYYGVIFPAYFRLQLRNIAWLKPFIIGFVCTGVIAVYPLLFHHLQLRESYNLSIPNLLYFITNWLFTTVIAIMFDIKDFVADHNYQLKTFVVSKGLRRTIFFVLLPLASASFASFVLFAVLKHFSVLQIVINLIPFCLLLWAATSLRRRKGIIFYLLVIDGLLLVKAAFGIVAMVLVK